MKPRLSVRIKKNLILVSSVRKGIVLESLLTRTETIMLAKRLAVIVMLNRGDSGYIISKTLKMSPSSVARFRKMLNAGLFKPIIRELRKQNRSFLDMLELILSAGLPSIAGPRHSRRLARLRRGDI